MGLLEESRWFLEMMNGPLEECVRGVIVCDKVSLSVV